MNDKHFDQRLKSVLDNMEPSYDPATWAMLAQRMDAAISEEQPAPVDAVDKAVYHALERLESPYQPAHWDMLARRMNRQALRLRRLHVAKALEATLILLFLWNVPMFLGETGHGTTPAPKARPNVPVAEAGPDQSPLRRTARAGSATASSAATMAALDRILSAESAPVLLDLDYTGASHVQAVLGDLDRLAQSANARIYASADLLPCDALMQFPVPDRSLNLLQAEAVIRKQHNQGPWYLAASAGADQNRVLINGERRTSNGYSSALAVGLRSKKWGVETGVGYTRKAYTPKRSVEIYGGNLVDGYYGSTLTEVSTDMITVPVKLSRQIARVGKTTAHAVAGVTAHIAAQKDYDYGTVYYPPGALPPNLLPDPGQVPKLRQSGRGVLEESGSLNGNIYASADAGVRIERPLAKGRYTAFLESTYRQSLTGKGIGPKREPINTLSLQAGFMAYL